ncbi:MAG: DUF1731 domain-containing protein [Tetrasphaera sp.]
MPHTVAVTGASGLIGSALVTALRARGDRAIALVRRAAYGPDERSWDPASGTLDPAVLDGVDAVVNLAGVGVGDKRWTTAHKREILRSRVNATQAVASGIQASGRAIRLVNGSAVGYYGHRGEELLTEDRGPGVGFLSEVVQAWEGAVQSILGGDPGAQSLPDGDPAAQSVLNGAAAAQSLPDGRPGGGVSVAFARTGIVASAGGGAFAPLIRLTRFGLGGPIGRGRFFWPLISLADEVDALLFLIDHPEITGPVNVVGLEPARQRDVAAALGAALHRPARLPAPPPAVRVVVGEFAGEITASQRVLPAQLVEAGFQHRHRDLEAIIRFATQAD